MSFWDSLTSAAGNAASAVYNTAGNVVSSAVDTVKNTDLGKVAASAASYVYDQAGDIATAAGQKINAGLDAVGDGLAKVADGVSVPWDTHAGMTGMPTAKPASKTPVALIAGAAAVVLLLVITSKKKGK